MLKENLLDRKYSGIRIPKIKLCFKIVLIIILLKIKNIIYLCDKYFVFYTLYLFHNIAMRLDMEN